jgi:hypothetical protein
LPCLTKLAANPLQGLIQSPAVSVTWLKQAIGATPQAQRAAFANTGEQRLFELQDLRASHHHRIAWKMACRGAPLGGAHRRGSGAFKKRGLIP